MSLLKNNMAYPLLFGILPAAVFYFLIFILKWEGFYSVVFLCAYSGFYIPFSLWIINRHFPFRVRSWLSLLFWVPYLLFSLMYIFFISVMGLISLVGLMIGQPPYSTVDPGFGLIALIFSVIVMALIMKFSGRTNRSVSA